MILDNLDRVLTSFDGVALKEGTEGAEKELTLRNLLRTVLLQDVQPQDNKGVRIERYKLAKHILTSEKEVELSATNVEMIMNRAEKFVNTSCLGVLHETLKGN